MALDSEVVWNRAALGDAGVERRSGDLALMALLSVHSLAMNGGLLHSVEVLDPSELDDAAEGFRYFGLGGAAAALEWARAQALHVDVDADPADAERIELEANARYWAAVPDDAAVWDAFVSKFSESPKAFAPKT